VNWEMQGNRNPLPTATERGFEETGTILADVVGRLL